MNEDVLDKTLEELDAKQWGEPNPRSYPTANRHRLCRVPLGQFTLEDLRWMLGRSRWLEYLVPLALQVLQRNPIAGGNLYPGDLLGAVLKQEASFWQEHPMWYADVTAILDKLTVVPEEIKQEVQRFQRIRL